MFRLFLATLSVCLLVSTSAWAQSNLQESDLDFMISTSTTTSTTAAVIGGIILTVVLTSSSEEAVAAYLKQNAVAVQHDLYLGAGDTAADLASLFGVPQERHAHFADLLFDHRESLAPRVTPGAVTDETARQFIEIVLAGMFADEALAEDARALL